MLQRLVLKMVGCLGIALRVEVQFPEVLERFRRDDVALDATPLYGITSLRRQGGLTHSGGKGRAVGSICRAIDPSKRRARSTTNFPAKISGNESVAPIEGAGR
jgi:hypothetical protein